MRLQGATAKKLAFDSYDIVSGPTKKSSRLPIKTDINFVHWQQRQGETEMWLQCLQVYPIAEDGCTLLTSLQLATIRLRARQELEQQPRGLSLRHGSKAAPLSIFRYSEH